jgi:hypothetical protein
VAAHGGWTRRGSRGRTDGHNCEAAFISSQYNLVDFPADSRIEIPRRSIIMKQYVIDELRPKDYEMIKAFMDENFGSSNVDGVYWLQLDHNILTPVQKEHTECQPFYVAVDLESNLVAFELLVRTKNRMRCSCMGYATEKQRNWLMGFADAMFDKLGIKT